MLNKLRSLHPRVKSGPNDHIVFEGSGKRTGEVVFLVEVSKRDYKDVYSSTLIVFDLETNKMHRQKRQKSGSTLLEIDLPSQLQAMKIFS